MEKKTTTDGSVIDYVIGSPFVLSKTPDFVVHDFDGVFSDKHSLVTWQMQSQCNINNLNRELSFQINLQVLHVLFIIVTCHHIHLFMATKVQIFSYI